MIALSPNARQALKSGVWLTRSFGWFYMMVSRLAGPGMTIAVAYLILYAIDSHHGLATPVAHPDFGDQLASFCSGFINVTPELVFPGTVVLCLQALARRRWDHFGLQLLASIIFATLTMILLNAFMSNGINDGFLAGMLLWRAASALFYTVVAEYCAHGQEHHDQAQPSAVLAAPPAPTIDLDEITRKIEQTFSEKIASLEAQIVTLSAPQPETKNDTPGAPETATQDDPESDTESDPGGATNITYLRTQKRTKTHTQNESDKAARARRYIHRNPQIGATELARKAEISVSYARKLLAEKRGDNQAVNQ